MSLTGASNTALSYLAVGLDERIGNGFKIESLVDLAPWLVEARVRDCASNRVFEARLYPVLESGWNDLKQIWSEQAPPALDPMPAGLRKTFGLKRLGNTIAHVGEAVEGLDLGLYLRHVGQCNPDYAVRAVLTMLNTLEELETSGQHHFQLKPVNVILSPDAGLILKNAGLAPFESEVARLLGVENLLDPAYLAPEQLQGEPLGAATDVYQLGLLLFEMVTGRPPFIGDAETVRDGQVSKAPPDPRTMNPAVNVGLTQILSRALAKNSVQRFKSLAEFKQALAFLLPGAERARLTGKLQKMDDKEKARVDEQLESARDLCIKEEHTEALRVVDALLMAHGPVDEALVLHREIWEVKNSADIYRRLERAVQMETSQPAQSLAALNSLLSLAPDNPQALTLQTRIFKAMKPLPPRPSASVAMEQLKSAAHMASAEGNESLAEILWTRILLFPPEMDAERRVALHDAQLAANSELRMMRGESAVLDADEEDLSLGNSISDQSLDLGDAQAAPVQSAATAKQAGSKKGLMIGGLVAALLILGVGGVMMLRMQQQAEYERLAGAAYEEAAATEADGNWEQALIQWSTVVAAYPDYNDTRTREKALKHMINQRKMNIDTHLANARDLMAAGIHYDQSEENAHANLTKVLTLDPENADALLMMDELRSKEAEVLFQLWESKKVLEAKAALDRMRLIDPNYKNEDLETGISEWVQTKFIDPRLKKMKAAVKKERWESAFTISDELRVYVDSPKTLDDYWNGLYDTHRGRFLEAQETNDLPKMLKALTVMSRIRPDDAQLVERRDTVSRELNKAKIEGLEEEITRLLSKGQVKTAAVKAKSLRKLDSKSIIADQATGSFRRAMENKVETAKKDQDPKAALKHYNSLLKVLNWRNFKTARDKLKKRVTAYDKAYKGVFAAKSKSFDEQKPLIEKFLSVYTDFSGDSNWDNVGRHKELVLKEERRYKAMKKWEQRVAGNINMPYQDIADKLKAETDFKLAWPQKHLTTWRKAYDAKVNAYEGKVTLLIRGAEGLPREKSGMNKAPESFCEIKVGDQTFKTAVIQNDHNPVWDHACSFQAKPGQKLNFKIYEVTNRGKISADLGEVSINSIPKTTKGMKLKSNKGWTLTLDIRRER